MTDLRLKFFYDNMGQLTSGKRYWSNDTPVEGQQFTYGYDDIGNRTTAAGGGDYTGANLRSTTYTTNALNQMTERTVPGYADIMGTVKPALTASTVTVNTNAAYRKADYFRKELSVTNTSDPVKLLAEIEAFLSPTTYEEDRTVYVPETPEVYTYDEDGNLLTDGRWTYTWNAENRLIKLETQADAVTAGMTDIRLEFIYDSNGRRVQKEVWDDTTTPTLISRTRFIYDGWNLVAEVDAPGTSPGTSAGLVRGYVWGLDLSGTSGGAGGVGSLTLILKPTGVGTACEVYAPAYDGNGNVMAIVRIDDNNSSAGDYAGGYEYDPYGNELVVHAGGDIAQGTPFAAVNPFRFSTKYRDSETGYLYFGYRYYEPLTGKWLNRDPIAEKGGANIYGYVGNEPLSSVDWLGLSKTWQVSGTHKGGIKVSWDYSYTAVYDSTTNKLEYRVRINLVGMSSKMKEQAYTLMSKWAGATKKEFNKWKLVSKKPKCPDIQLDFRAIFMGIKEFASFPGSGYPNTYHMIPSTATRVFRNVAEGNADQTVYVYDSTERSSMLEWNLGDTGFTSTPYHTAVHEVARMFGLEDEYLDSENYPDKREKNLPPDHRSSIMGMNSISHHTYIKKRHIETIVFDRDDINTELPNAPYTVEKR